MLSQPVRSRIILHPLAFVFHASPVFGLVIAGRLFEIQTSTHNQLRFKRLSSAKCIPRFTACEYSIFYSKTLVASFTPRIRAEMVLCTKPLRTPVDSTFTLDKLHE